MLTRAEYLARIDDYLEAEAPSSPSRHDARGMAARRLEWHRGGGARVAALTFWPGTRRCVVRLAELVTDRADRLEGAARLFAEVVAFRGRLVAFARALEWSDGDDDAGGDVVLRAEGGAA